MQRPFPTQIVFSWKEAVIVFIHRTGQIQNSSKLLQVETIKCDYLLLKIRKSIKIKTTAPMPIYI
jgi:hypothetical protein